MAGACEPVGVERFDLVFPRQERPKSGVVPHVKRILRAGRRLVVDNALYQ